MRTRSGRVTARSRLGQGARTIHRYRKFPPYKSVQRSFVPRTMGPFAASESKYFTTEFGNNILSTTNWTGTELDPATILSLCCPQEGSDIDNRIGRKISVYKIALRGLLQWDLEGDEPDILPSPAFRLILYIDQQTNGTQAQGEQVMTPVASSDEIGFCSFQNLANLGRFRVLKDKVYRGTTMTAGTDGTNTVSVSTAPIPFKMTVRFRKPVIVRFNATNGGTIGDIVDNSFHLIGCKSSPYHTVNLTYQCRAYFKDV